MKMIMKAIRIHQYGGPEVLAQVEMQRPAPGANEVLIKVHAASVNPVDWKMRAGYMKDFLPLALPRLLGRMFQERWKRLAPVRLDSNGATKYTRAWGWKAAGTRNTPWPRKRSLPGNPARWITCTRRACRWRA